MIILLINNNNNNNNFDLYFLNYNFFLSFFIIKIIFLIFNLLKNKFCGFFRLDASNLMTLVMILKANNFFFKKKLYDSFYINYKFNILSRVSLILFSIDIYFS